MSLIEDFNVPLKFTNLKSLFFSKNASVSKQVTTFLERKWKK
jgi:hypothetical protein